MKKGQKVELYDILERVLKNPEVSQLQLAKELGISRQRLSKIVEKLIREGVLDYETKRHFVVKRLDIVNNEEYIKDS